MRVEEKLVELFETAGYLTYRTKTHSLHIKLDMSTQDDTLRELALRGLIVAHNSSPEISSSIGINISTILPVLLSRHYSVYHKETLLAIYALSIGVRALARVFLDAREALPGIMEKVYNIYKAAGDCLSFTPQEYRTLYNAREFLKDAINFDVTLSHYRKLNPNKKEEVFDEWIRSLLIR